MQSFEFYWTPTYFILVSAVTGCVSISDFASLVDISVGVTSSAVELKFFVITEGVKKYKSSYGFIKLCKLWELKIEIY